MLLDKDGSKTGTSECIHLTAEGCSVYEDRPAVCRYYALGSMGVRKKEASSVDDIYFVVKEDHCLGHNEPKNTPLQNIVTLKGLINMTR